MVLNDIIEQAAGRQSQTPEQGGNVLSVRIFFAKKASQRKYIVFLFFFLVQFLFRLFPRRKCVYPVYRAISIPRRSMYIICIWF